jgi:hypothetical protein
MTVIQPIATTVDTGTPVIGLAPATLLVMRAAGRMPISTVGEPITIAPVQAAPETESPRQAAGSPPINTVGIPGPVITSPEAVVSVNLAAGNGIFLLYCFKNRSFIVDLSRSDSG